MRPLLARLDAAPPLRMLLVGLGLGAALAGIAITVAERRPGPELVRRHGGYRPV